MHSSKPWFGIALSVVAVAAFLVAVLEIARLFWNFVSVQPNPVAVAVIGAAASVFVSALTIAIGRYFERKRELDALHRDKKVEVYDEFLRKLFDVLYANKDKTGQPDELVQFLRDFVRKLILWSGPGPIISFLKWKQHLELGVPDAESIFMTETFLLAIREDLRHSNRGIPRGFFAHFFLRHASIFLAAAERNPNVTLTEVAALEQQAASARPTT